MAIVLSDNIQVNAPKPADSRYLNNLTPYASVSAANTAIVSGVRFTGLTVNILGSEYWYKNGITDGCLISKSLGGTITGGANGLSVSGENIILGGTLTGSTLVDINQKDIAISGTYAYLAIEDLSIGSAGLYMLNGANTGWGFLAHTGYTELYARNITKETIIKVIADSTPKPAIYVCGSSGFSGIEYCQNYCANYSNRSLVDKWYVDYKTSGITGTITGGTNGLSVSGKNLKLGGNLTGKTNISLNSTGANLIITGITTTGSTTGFGLSIMDWDGYSINPRVSIGQLDSNGFPNKHYFYVDQGGTSTAHCQGTCCGCFTIGSTDVRFTTLDTTTPTQVTQSIFMSQTNKNLRLFSTSGNSGCKAELYIGLGCMRICGATPTGFTGVQYDSNYCAYFKPRSLVDKAYVDSIVNILNVCNVTTQYSACTKSEFIGVSGATCVYLMLNPQLGQKVSVADIAGAALSNPITVDGNGKRINDPVSTTTMINTNYGSVTFVYNGYFWSAIAFTN